jgi:pyrimidine deaminase RibD-like protein
MDENLKLKLMREAISEAHKSQAEDGRNHPLVGAIITDDDGKIFLRAHRGENGGGGHAEFLIFQKAQDEKIDLSDKTLFVTLEPCTRRGAGKIPCAVRVANSGIIRFGVLVFKAHGRILSLSNPGAPQLARSRQH